MSNEDSTLDAIRRETPNLILLNVQLPNGRRFQICSAIKRDPLLKHISVILLSAKKKNLDQEPQKHYLQPLCNMI